MSPPPPFPLLRRPAPAPLKYPFLNFSDPPSRGGNQTLFTFPTLKRMGGRWGSGLCKPSYFWMISVILRIKSFSVVATSDLELDFHPPLCGSYIYMYIAIYIYIYIYIYIRVGLNRSWFVVHNEILKFHDWILCYYDPFHDKIKR